MQEKDEGGVRSTGGERSEPLVRSASASMLPEGIEEEILPDRRIIRRISDAEAEEILELFEASRKRGYSLVDSYRWTARRVGRHPKTIALLVRQLNPTVRIAERRLKASALKMVDKVLAKANTGELIDLLSRPNIGVLAPVKQQQSGGGFFLNVTADSLGAVNINTGEIHEQIHDPQRAQSVGATELRGESSGQQGSLPPHGDTVHILTAEQVGGGDGAERIARSPQEESHPVAQEAGTGGHERVLGDARPRHASQLGLQGAHGRTEKAAVKRRHQKGGVLDRSIHLDTPLVTE